MKNLSSRLGFPDRMVSFSARNERIFFIRKPFVRMNNISSLQIFNIFRFVSTLLIGVLLTKLGLPTAEISIYELLIFLSTLVSFFWVMGGQNAFLQYFPKLDASTQKKAFFNSFLLFVGLSLVAAATLWGLCLLYTSPSPRD